MFANDKKYLKNYNNEFEICNYNFKKRNYIFDYL